MFTIKTHFIMHNGINAQHYGKVIAERIEKDLPIGGHNPFIAQRIEPNENVEDEIITDRDMGDEQPADSIEFRNAINTTKILNNLFSSFSQIF